MTHDSWYRRHDLWYVVDSGGCGDGCGEAVACSIRVSYLLLLYDILSYLIPSCHVLCYAVVWYHMTSYHISLSCMFLFAIILYRTALYWTVQEPLGEYVRLIVSVKNALQQRQDKKADYLASLTDVEAKQIAHNKIALSPAKEDQACIKLVSWALHSHNCIRPNHCLNHSHTHSHTQSFNHLLIHSILVLHNKWSHKLSCFPV